MTQRQSRPLPTILICGTMSFVLILPTLVMAVASAPRLLAGQQDQGSSKKDQKQTLPPKQDPPPQPLDMIKLEASYDEHLLPIFEQQCAECHDAGEAELELSLMEFSTFLKGSIDGPIIEPGKPAESKLFKVIQEGSDPHMPPDDQLSDEDVAVIKKWIDELPPALKKKLGERTDDGQLLPLVNR